MDDSHRVCIGYEVVTITYIAEAQVQWSGDIVWDDTPSRYTCVEFRRYASWVAGLEKKEEYTRFVVSKALHGVVRQAKTKYI